VPLPIRSHPRLASCALLAATASALALVAGGTAQAITAQPASHHAGLASAPTVNLSMDYTAPFVINPQSPASRRSPCPRSTWPPSGWRGVGGELCPPQKQR
jgi:hypothetical protein